MLEAALSIALGLGIYAVMVLIAAGVVVALISYFDRKETRHGGS